MDPLPSALAEALADFGRHLEVERDRSAHTVRAYTGDVAALLDHAAQLGVVSLDELDVRVLRAWLGAGASAGAARSTLARRAAAARTFTAWATRTGRLAVDPGLLLGVPRARTALPGVLRQDQAAGLMDVAALAADDGSPSGLRDRAVLEVLYATGVRVGELVALDIDDLDHGRRTLRVLGKGRKERTVPLGLPAVHAVDDWLRRGRPVLVDTWQRRGAVPRGARRPARPACGPYAGARPPRPCGGGSRSGTARSETLRCDTSARRRG